MGKAKRLQAAGSAATSPPISTPAPRTTCCSASSPTSRPSSCPSEAQSLLLENNLIKEYQPRFNVRLKDDKSYPSIAVTLAEPFPRVLVTRRRDIPGRPLLRPLHRRRPAAPHARHHPPDLHRAELRRRPSRASGGSGPASTTTSGAARRPASAGRPRRTTERMIDGRARLPRGTDGGRPGRRSARPMVAASEREDFERAKDLRDALRWLERLEEPASVEVIGTGDADVDRATRATATTPWACWSGCATARVVGREHRFLEDLEEEPDGAVLSAFLVRYYVPAEDRAPPGGDPVPAGTTGMPCASCSPRPTGPSRSGARRTAGSSWPTRTRATCSRAFGSSRSRPRSAPRIRCTRWAATSDSAPCRAASCASTSRTIRGRDTVGSLVWFEAGRPKKSEYRKFKIQGLGQQDDFAAIHEVITRYLTRRRDEALPLPDLIVIDGGKGQLNAALDAMETARAASRSRWSAWPSGRRRSSCPAGPRALRLSRRSPSLRLLQRARDEAHRFGLAYNRKRRTARTITSELLNIPGVGTEPAPRLLERFGSLAGVRVGVRRRARHRAGILHPARRAHPVASQPQVSAATPGLDARVLELRRARAAPTACRPSATAAACRGWCAIPPRVPTLVDRAELRRRHGMWRFRAFLPLLARRGAGHPGGRRHAAACGSSGRGGDSAVGDLWVKDEGANPTGSFKARGISAAITRAVRRGGGALRPADRGQRRRGRGGLRRAGRLPGPSLRAAHHAADHPVARSRLRRRPDPARRSHRRLRQARRRACAAETGRHGSVHPARAVSDRRARRRWASSSRMQLGWTLPDAIIYPTGGGTGLIGMWKAFQELLAAGWVQGTLPRMYTVQSAGCAPVVRAFHAARADQCEPWPIRGPSPADSGCRRRSAIG